MYIEPQSYTRLELLLFTILQGFPSQEAQEPESRGFGVAGEAVSVVHVNQTETFGVALTPFEVVQQRPRKVSPHINSIPVPKDKGEFNSKPVNMNVDECQ